jgi:predicted RNA binding protein YcfA (HicA-like mRNA interferase family)
MDELSSREVGARLLAEGWIAREGHDHTIYKHPKRPRERIVVPRHRTLSIGVARQIAKIAGWR